MGGASGDVKVSTFGAFGALGCCVQDSGEELVALSMLVAM